MNKLNNKGFTLVELMATIVILSLVITIGAVSITSLINNAKEKNYDLLVEEIKNAVEEFYIECKFDSDSTISSICPPLSGGYYETTLKTLVTSGFLKGNSTDNDKKFTIVNPKDNENIENCWIKYKYEGGQIKVQAITTTGSCPTTY